MSRVGRVLRVPLVLVGAVLVFAVCVVVLTIGAILTSFVAAALTIHTNLTRRTIPDGYVTDGITSIEQHLAKETGQ